MTKVQAVNSNRLLFYYRDTLHNLSYDSNYVKDSYFTPSQRKIEEKEKKSEKTWNG